MPVNTKNLTLNYATAVESKFANLQDSVNKEIKSIATKLALNEMLLNKWSKDADLWEQVYKTVWIEKEIFVRMSYDVSSIATISKQLLTGQQKMITALGVIVSNTGQILENQEIIIDNQGIIIDTTGEILGTVKDIQINVNDIVANGVKVQNNYTGSQTKKYIWLVVGVLLAVILFYIVLKIFKGRKK